MAADPQVRRGSGDAGLINSGLRRPRSARARDRRRGAPAIVETHADTDTIVAIATPAGAGGVGIVRMSGPRAHAVAATVCGGVALPARRARHVQLRDGDGSVIDDGIALLFDAPASFTGEDVAELQAHGSPPLLQALVDRCCALGARRALAGEFSARAFANGKLDLAQAEAVADLIAAGDLRAARAARRSLEGVFSARVDALADAVLAIRVQVEALIDFVDEPLETLGIDALGARLEAARTAVAQLQADASRGLRLRDGLHAVIVGPPNAGKSSLLNALAATDRAIVTATAGTTRDLLRETVQLDGVALTLVDTAGLHEGGDDIEREGMRRARAELARADVAIAVLDALAPERGRADIEAAIADAPRVLWLLNKCDLGEAVGGMPLPAGHLRLSVLNGDGVAEVAARLRDIASGDGGDEVGGAFTARARHVEAIGRAGGELAAAGEALRDEALELAAEALRAGHDALGEVTGRVTPDQLLGHVFATFCIGK